MGNKAAKGAASTAASTAKKMSTSGRSPMKIAEKHFILGTPMKGPWGPDKETLWVATGCFWGAEKGFWRLPGVVSTAVGYLGGHAEHPTYEEVCSESTGHCEGVQIVFDPAVINLTDILRYFFECHDPTQGDRQGGDRGARYRSAIFHSNPEQEALAHASKTAYEKAMGKVITTQIAPAPKFFYAEDYHQQYLAKPGSRPYCSAMPTGTVMPDTKLWVPDELQSKYEYKMPPAFWEEHHPSPHCVLRAPDAPIEWK